MSPILEILLQDIKKKKTIKEIAEDTQLSYKQIYNYLLILKNKGYQIESKYYSDGEIVYNLTNDLFRTEKRTTIITRPTETKLKIMAIADTHLGHPQENLNYLDMVYNECIKNDIHHIFIAGDLVDDRFKLQSDLFESIDDEINYAIKVYPHHPGILNYIVYGNHEANILYKYCRNVGVEIENRRNDMISLGFDKGQIWLKKDKITLRHAINHYERVDIGKAKIVIEGHHHKSFYSDGRFKNISIPACSDIVTENNIPGFIIANFEFFNGYVSKIIWERYHFINNQVVKFDTIVSRVSLNKNAYYKSNISNEEDYKRGLLKQNYHK